MLVRIFSDMDPEKLFLTVDGRNYIIRSAVSASGAKYEAVNDPETSLCGKSASVTLTVGGVVYPGYAMSGNPLAVYGCTPK